MLRWNSYALLLSIIVLSILGRFCESGWIYDLNKANCGTFFSNNGFSGFNKSISNGKMFTDLSIFSLNPRLQNIGESTSDNWDNQISSVLVQKDCRVRVCQDADFDGSCTWLKESKTTLDPAWAKKISSVGCGCPVPNCQAQTCSNVILRDNECGRAFFEPNCNTCDGRFLTIRQMEQDEVGNYAEDISSILVKPGCKFHAFELSDFGGKETILDSTFEPDWNKKNRIRSYNCFCLNATSSPTPRMPNPTDPALISLPLTTEENIKMAERYPDHPGLSAALTSMRNNRSPRNAYILVIGLTGSGKSASINLLFDNEVTKVGGQESVTHAIHEFRIPVQVDELGCKNCELRVIDTPGFGDTGGLDSDANFLAGLEEYLSNHEELKDRLPNVVLVFSKFSDNRLGGKSSQFVKALRGIDFFRDRLFDLKYSNAVTVLTHFMSETSKIRKNPAAKLKQFREVIEEFTLFPKPLRIVVAENKPDEQGLPMINGYYYLPNKEYYPQNIFEKMQEATGAHDPIGEAIIRNAFKRPEDFNVTEHKFALKGVRFGKEQHYLSKLNKGNFDIEKTEISNITETVFEEHISADLKRKYPGSLQYTQRVLNLQGIFTRQDIPRTTIGIVKLFKNMRHNPLIEDLLSKAFDLKIPEFGISIVAGQGYNILKDTVLPSSPFLKTELGTSDIGYKIPTSVTCKLMSEMSDIFNWYNTHQDYLTNRIASMKVDEGQIREELTGEIRYGFNTLEDYNSEGSRKQEVSALREYRLFQITLNENLKLDPVFETMLRNIPVFEATNHVTVEKWKQFFSKYGTHVVRSVFGGGAIGGKFKIRNQNTPTEEALGQYKNSIQEFFRFLHDIYLKKKIRSNDISTANVTYVLKFFGGDFKHHVADFSRLSIEETSAVLDGFEESLSFQPTILTSSMELIPLSEVVKKTDSAGSAKIIQAAKALFNASLAYVPPGPEQPPLERPEVKKHIKELSDEFVKQIEGLTSHIENSSRVFNNFTRSLIEESQKERDILLEKINKERRQTLKDIAVSCHYEQPDLKGDYVCAADMRTCLSIGMPTVKSVNTHEACIRFYSGNGCAGPYKEHISDERTNTTFPFNIQDGDRFSLIRCDSPL